MMPNESPQNQGSLAERPFIAVVDDDASFLRSVGRLLRSVGYAVGTFSTGQQFLSSLSDWLPQCLVVDVHMPEMSGLELEEKLAAQGYQMPVIFVTAYDTPRTREHARRPGIFGLLLKPFDNEALLRAVREATGCQVRGREGERRGPGWTGDRGAGG
jgi:FixJ family two-component response regulator